MPLFTKPQFNSVWASAGTKLTPDNSKISLGWVVEIPPHEYENWIQNRQDAMLAHLNQLGIPLWDSTVEYQAGKSYVQGVTSGVVYRALTTNTNINPEIDISNNWAVAFEASGNALLKSQNLADVPDKALARTNLGIATTEFYDGRYLIKTNNLADVPNKATARTNLDIYSKLEVEALINSLQPAGQVSYFAMLSPPAGWLVMDGSAVSRSTYARLFSAIGTTFGAGNGSTTFNLPDARGQFFRALDMGKGIDIGRSLGSLQSSQNQVHSHTVNDPGHVHSLRRTGNDGNFGIFDMISGDSGVLWRNNTDPAFTGISINNSGGNESRPTNIAFLPCIRT